MPGSRLTFEDRVRIEAYWVAGSTISQIAAALGRAVTTISRELQQYNSHRHGPKNPLGARGDGAGFGGVYRWGYDADHAQERARLRALRPKTPRLSTGQPLRKLVLKMLRQRYSPEQIAGRLRHSFRVIR